jgi:hypothetical protein
MVAYVAVTFLINRLLRSCMSAPPGANVAHAGVMGLTALHFAAERGDVESVVVLLDALGGRDAAQLANDDGMLPIHVCQTL